MFFFYGFNVLTLKNIKKLFLYIFKIENIV